MHIGNYSLGQIIRFEVSGRDATGIDSAFSGSPSFNVWKDGGTTQRSSANGIAATLEFDSDVGHIQVSIDTNDNTHAGFWERGSLFTIEVTSLTIDGLSVSVRHTFGIEYTHETGRLIFKATSQGVGASQITLAAGTVTALGTVKGMTVKELVTGQERVIISENSGTDICGINSPWNPSLSGTPKYNLYAGSPDYTDPVPADVTKVSGDTSLAGNLATLLADDAVEVGAGSVNTDINVLQALRMILSAAAAKASKSGDDTIFRDIQDTVNRFTSTATSASGRTDVTLGDLTS